MKGKFVVCLLAIFSFVLVAKADCDGKTLIELDTAAANVSANYEMGKAVMDNNGTLHPEINIDDVHGLDNGYVVIDVVKLNILNITDNIYATLENTDDNVLQTIHASDTNNGVYVYNVPDIDKIRTYNVKLYSNNSSCMDKELRTTSVVTPMYNQLSDRIYCLNSSEYYCQRYVTTTINVDEAKLMEDYLASNEEESTNNTKENDNKPNIWFIIGAFGVIIALITAIFVVIMKNKTVKF